MKANSSLRLTQISPAVEPSTILTVERSVAIVYGIDQDPNAAVKVVSYQVSSATPSPSAQPTPSPSVSVRSAFKRVLAAEVPQYFVSFTVGVTILKTSSVAVATTPTELAQKQQDLLVKSYLNGNLSAVMNTVALNLGVADVNSVTVFVVPFIIPSPMPTAKPIFLSPTSQNSNRLSVGAIIGIVIGCIVFATIALALLRGLFFSKGKRVSKYAIYSVDTESSHVPRNEVNRNANDAELAPLARTDHSVVKSSKVSGSSNRDRSFAGTNPIYKDSSMRVTVDESEV